VKEWCEWAENNTLRAAFDLTVNGGTLNAADALTALGCVADESARLIQEYVGAAFYEKYFPTNRTGGLWAQGNPFGVVDHYTAGIHTKGTLRWFSSEPRKNDKYTSSANVVIAPEGEIIFVVNPMTTVAWHARKDSHTHIGVEHVNAGLLRKKGEDFYYQGTRPYPHGWTPNVQKVGDEYWEPYTADQIMSNIILKRWLIAAIPTLNKGYFVDHEMIDPLRKRDCGPLWPLQTINELAFSTRPLYGMRWAQKKHLGIEDIADLRKEVFES